MYMGLIFWSLLFIIGLLLITSLVDKVLCVEHYDTKTVTSCLITFVISSVYWYVFLTQSHFIFGLFSEKYTVLTNVLLLFGVE